MNYSGSTPPKKCCTQWACRHVLCVCCGGGVRVHRFIMSRFQNVIVPSTKYVMYLHINVVVVFTSEFCWGNKAGKTTDHKRVHGGARWTVCERESGNWMWRKKLCAWLALRNEWLMNCFSRGLNQTPLLSHYRPTKCGLPVLCRLPKSFLWLWSFPRW